MPHELFKEVEKYIPNHIGVYTGKGCIKKSKKQILNIDEKILMQSMIRSLSREFDFHYKSGDDSKIRRYQRQIKNLERDKQDYHRRWMELYDGLTREERKRILGY